MTGMTRRQFFGAMKSAGFSKSRLQMTRLGLSYERDDEGKRVVVTVPKNHSKTFTIIGGGDITGVFLQKSYNNSKMGWGNVVDPSELGLNNMLEVCLGIVTGNITRS